MYHLCRPTKSFKPASPADHLLNEARRRYRRLARTSQPGVQPHNILGLFGPHELLTLALARRWPLSPSDVRHITGRLPEPATATEGY